MQKQKNRIAQTSAQILRMRKLYSRIGEPLPADVIIDLARHLNKALELADEDRKSFRSKITACGKLN